MLKALLIVVSLGSILFAETIEEFPFIGVTVSTQTIDLKKQSQKKTTTTLQYGKQTIEMRTTFGFEFAKGYRSFNLEIDKILMDELFGRSEYRPYAGLVLGSLHFEDDNHKENGYYYGAAAGLILYVTDTIDADLSYHYYKTESLDSIDHIRGASFSLHYFY